MASCDYYLCDICYTKTFYDAHLSYDYDAPLRRDGKPALFRVGEMLVLCVDCSADHEIRIVKREAPAAPGDGPP